eukprot:PhF_6_TR23817/c0_g1_i1/m.33360
MYRLGCRRVVLSSMTAMFVTQTRSVVEIDDAITAVPGVRLPGTAPEPTTHLSGICDQLSELTTRFEEIKTQLAAVRHPNDERAQKKLQIQQSRTSGLEPMPTVTSKDVLEGYVTEIRTATVTHIESVYSILATPGMVQTASTAELRRCLFYCANMRQFNWISELLFAQTMKIMAQEFVRRMKLGTMTQDDVIYVATFIAVSDYYNKPLWTALEYALSRGTFSQLDKGIIKGMTTRLFRTKRGSKAESVDLRRQLLKAMSRRVGELVNELELPQILRIIQCYTLHDIFPKPIFDLATRAMMNVHEYNATESAILCQIFGRWRILTPEVCERLLEKISSAETLTAHMESCGLQACKTMYRKLSLGSSQTEIERQKLRQLGEKLASRLDEVTFKSHVQILQVLDAIVVLRLYLPQKVIQAVFASASTILSDPNVGKRVNLEQGRQLLALLEYFGVEYSRTLAVQLRKMFKDGVLEEEILL